MKRAPVCLTVRLSSVRYSDPARAPLPPTLSTRSFNWQFPCAHTDAAERCSSCLRVPSCGGGRSCGQPHTRGGPPSLNRRNLLGKDRGGGEHEHGVGASGG